MNARKTFQRVMRFEPTDGVPVLALEPYEQSGLEKWRREGLPEGKSPEEFLGMDRLVSVPAPLRPVPAFERRIISENDKEIVETDWMGTTVRRLKEAPAMYYGHIDHPVKSREDWLRYREHFRADSAERLPASHEDTLGRLVDSPNPVTLNLFPFFFRLGFYSMGMERFMLAFHDAPELIHEMFSYWSEFVLSVIRPFLSTVKIDVVCFTEDLAYRNGPHLSPQIYQDFWLPYQKPILQELRRHGVQVINMWTSGNIDVLIPLLLDCGFNCTWPCDQNSSMDPVRLRKEYGRDLLLAGGISKDALMNGPKAIDQAIDRLMPLIEEGGFFPALDDVVPPEVSFKHYSYYVKRLREIRRSGSPV